MDDIRDIFNQYLQHYGSVDIAESEFKKSLHEDPELKQLYREWCSDVGSSERNGFKDYCEEYLESQNDVWESLNDFDE